MKNPLRSEAEAYQFLIATIAYFAVIAIAAKVGGRWVGLGVFVAATAIALWLWLRSRRDEPPVRAVAAAHPDNERRILVIANETVGGESLRSCIRKRSEGYDERILVVCPALNSPLRHWVSDEDAAREAARERLERSIARLAELGIDARGEIGDGDPIQAIEDGVRTFGPDELIISTHPEGRSHWLERRVVERARERVDVPVTHVVVDLEAERETIHEAAASPASSDTASS